MYSKISSNLRDQSVDIGENGLDIGTVKKNFNT